MLNLKQLNKITDVFIIMLSIVIVFEIVFYHSVVVEWLTNIVTNAGVWGWFVLCVVQFLQIVIIPIPSAFITLTSMKMYPDQLWTLYGALLCTALCAVIVTYLIGRKWGKKAVIWCAGSDEEYEKWLTVLKNKKTNAIYFLTVLFPVFPDDTLCLMAGSIKMNFWWYLFCNIVGRAIGLATFMFMLKVVADGISTIIVLFALLLTLIVIKVILKRRLTRESSCDR